MNPELDLMSRRQTGEPDSQNARPWPLVPLRDIARLTGGITKGQKRRHSTVLRKVPYLRVANVQRGYLDLSEVKEIDATEQEVLDLALQPGDILFNEGGDRDKLGRGWVWNGELPLCIHQNHVFRARLRNPSNNPKFISYYANSIGQKYFYNEGKHTTNLASINLTKLGSLPVPHPEPPVQQLIVSEIEKHFTRLDAAVVGLTAAQEKLRLCRGSILAALTPRAPSASEGWRTTTLGEACQVVIGFAFKSSEFSTRGIRLLRGENIEPGSLRWQETRFWPESKAAPYTNLAAEVGDIILAMDRPLVSAGLKLARVRQQDVPCLLVQRVARLRPKAGVDGSFVYGAMQGEKFIRHLHAGQTGTQLPHISGRTICSFPLLLPSESEQCRLGLRVAEMMEGVERIRRELSKAVRRADVLKASILESAFAGQLLRQSGAGQTQEGCGQ